MEIRREKLKEQLLRKLQSHLKKLGHHPSKTPLPREGKTEAVLRGWVLGLETPNLIDPSFRTQQQRRYNAALKDKKQEHPSENNSNLTAPGDRLESSGVKVDDVDRLESSDYFSDIDSGSWGNKSDEGSISLIPYESEFIKNDSVLTNADHHTISTGDRKYSREDIFRLCSSKEVCLEFKEYL